MKKYYYLPEYDCEFIGSIDSNHSMTTEEALLGLVGIERWGGDEANPYLLRYERTDGTSVIFETEEVWESDYTPEEVEASKVAMCNALGFSSGDLVNAIEQDHITLNITANNREVAWYCCDGESEAAVYVDTLEELTTEELENLLF